MDHGRVNYASSVGRGTPWRWWLRRSGEPRGSWAGAGNTPQQQQIANIWRARAQRAKQEHYRMGARFRGMADPFHRAEAWRQRADQLRNLAARTRDPVASTSLDLTAEAVDQHARK